MLVESVLDAHARVVLSEHGGGASHESQPAMDQRDGQSDRVQQAAAANDEDHALAVQMHIAKLPHHASQ